MVGYRSSMCMLAHVISKMLIDFVRKPVYFFITERFTSWLGSNISGEMEPSAFRKASNSTDSLFGIYSSSRCQVTCLLLKATVVISCLDSTQKPP